MFNPLDVDSPGLDISHSDVFPDGSGSSDHGREDSDLPPADKGYPRGSMELHDEAEADDECRMGNDGRVAEAAYGAECFDDDDDAPTPLPPSLAGDDAFEHYVHRTTSPYPLVGTIEGTNSLINDPELYAQFLPPPNPEAYIDPVFPPSPSRVYSAHAALRSAISQPHFPSPSDAGVLPFGCGRHHPYSCSPHPSSLPRTSSTTSLRFVSGASSSLSMPPSAPSPAPYYPQYHVRPGSALSAFSTASVPLFGVRDPSTSSYSASGESLPISRSTSGGSDEVYTPLTDTFDEGISRYYPLSERGARSDPLLAYCESSYLPMGTADGREMAVQPQHLFMSGLGGAPGSMSSSEVEARRVSDEDAWKSIRGNGLLGEADDSDEEEEEEIPEPYLDNNVLIPGTSDADETDEPESGSDTPLAVIRGRNRTYPIPAEVPSPDRTPSSPTPTPQHHRVDASDLSLVPSLEDKSAEKHKQPRSKKGGRRLGGVRKAGLGLEVVTLKSDEMEAIQRRRAEALNEGAEPGLEVSEEDAEVLDQEAGVARIPGFSSSPDSFTNPYPAQVINLDAVDPILRRPFLPSPMPCLLDLPTPDGEAEFHPSGRPKRSATRIIVPTTTDSSSDTATAYAEDESQEVDDEIEWRDINDLESEEESADGPRRSRKKFGKFKEAEEGQVRRHADPEIWAKVESLRERLVDPGKRTGNFDEKLCQLLQDSRFSPDYITWNEDGDKIVILDFERFWVNAGPYVMCAQTKRSAFDKQLSNHGFKRETQTTNSKVRKTLTHPMLARDDPPLWAAVAKLGTLAKWGKGSGRSSSSGSSKTSSLTALRQTVAARDSTIAALTAEIAALQLDKERALGQFALVCPGAWTEDNVMSIFGLKPDQLPTSLPILNPSLSSNALLLDTGSAASGSSTSTVDESKKVTRKRSRQGVIVVSTSKDATESVIAEETEAESGREAEVAVEISAGRSLGRKRSKVVLARTKK